MDRIMTNGTRLISEIDKLLIGKLIIYLSDTRINVYESLYNCLINKIINLMNKSNTFNY